MEQILTKIQEYNPYGDECHNKNIIDEINKFKYFSSPLQQIENNELIICNETFKIPSNCFINEEKFEICWTEKSKSKLDDFENIKLLEEYHSKYQKIISFLRNNNNLD